jgi:multidrug transporter EmrE-like cation transporter
MIQRIQTVYLALALVLFGLASFLPLAEVAEAGNLFTFSTKGLVSATSGEVVYSGLPLLSLAILVLAINLFVIFNFKKRVRQMRMSLFNIFLMLGSLGVSFVFLRMSIKEMAEAVTAYKIFMVFPAISAIFNYLAIRAIGKDEALIRSIDRIR